MHRPGCRAPWGLDEEAPSSGKNVSAASKGTAVRNTILGISAFYHDSAAALLINGEIAAAAHEERFTRKQHDCSFPIDPVRYVIHEAGADYKDLTAVAF